MSSEWETLPGWVYNSPEVFAEEADRIFLGSWQLVGHVNEIKRPGEYVRFDLLDQSALVVRGEDGTVRAFHNVCRHRAFRLLDGHHGACKNLIRCRYHGWSYDLSGRLAGLPDQDTFESLDRAAFGLTPIELEIVLGFVFIRFRPGGAALTDEIGPILAPLSRYRMEEMEPLGPHTVAPIRADWKIAVENNSEAYHVPIGHPGLQRLYGPTYRLEILGNGTSTGGGRLCQSNRRSTWSERHYLKLLPEVAHLPEEARRSWHYYSTFPNLAFDMYPDQIDYFQILPVAPGRCVSRSRAYALPDARREMRAARWLNQRINSQVAKEDVGLVEGTQAGLASMGYRAGPLSRKEARIKLFQDRIRELVPLVRSPVPPRRQHAEARGG